MPFRDSVLTMLLKDSLVGCARASVVVTVSQDATSEKETAASLRFAARCAEVRGVVRARSEPEDPRKLEATLRVQLNAVYTAMREMAAQGMAGGEDASASLASRQLFRSSKARLDAASAEALIARQNLVELAASGHGAASRSAAQQRQQRAEEQIRIQKGVLARMAHSGLWRGARPVYLTKQAEAIALRRRLQQLTGNDSAVPRDVVFADAHMTVQHMCSQ